jgi:ribonuclease HII
MRMLDDALERALFAQGFSAVCGVDEAGRGPLCGPVCAAAVILPPGLFIDGLDDSKRLTEKRREALFEVIVSSAVAFSVAYASPQEIDELNILNATFLAMRRAVESLSPPADFALVDGDRVLGLSLPYRCVPGGDGISPSIAAASVLAKVSRDRLMAELHDKYPQYNLKKHKGYGTAEHYALIAEHGVADIYRKSFLKTLHKHIAR